MGYHCDRSAELYALVVLDLPCNVVWIFRCQQVTYVECCCKVSLDVVKVASQVGDTAAEGDA